MKKLLTLVLVLAVASMASASATFTVTQGTGADEDKVFIAYTGEIVGLALDIDSDVSINAVSLPIFFDVYMDYASDQAEGTYVIGEGTPIADIAAAGEIGLPATDFCISAGGLEDDEFDLAPTSGTITLTIDGYESLTEGTYTIVVSENSLRGGVVGFEGALTTDLTTTGSVDIVIEGEEPTVCLGDINDDGAASAADITHLINYLNANGVGPQRVVLSSSGSFNPAADINDDGAASAADITHLINYLNANGVGPQRVVMCN